MASTRLCAEWAARAAPDASEEARASKLCPIHSIPLKTFWEAVERRLAACSTDELRAILRAMASETPPTARQAFLEKLERVEDAGDAIDRALQQDELLSDIDDLAEELEAGRQLAAAEQVLGWSSSNDPQGLVVAFFLVLLSGSAPGALPANLAHVWRRRLDDSTDAWSGSEQDELQARLARAYTERFATVALSGESQERSLSWCLDVAERRIDAIVGGQHRGTYDKAATLAVACAELLQLRGDQKRSAAWVDQVRTRFPRHRAFQAELRTALARMER